MAAEAFSQVSTIHFSWTVFSDDKPLAVRLFWWLLDQPTEI